MRKKDGEEKSWHMKLIFCYIGYVCYVVFVCIHNELSTYSSIATNMPNETLRTSRLVNPLSSFR